MKNFNLSEGDKCWVPADYQALRTKYPDFYLELEAEFYPQAIDAIKAAHENVEKYRRSRSRPYLAAAAALIEYQYRVERDPNIESFNPLLQTLWQKLMESLEPETEFQVEVVAEVRRQILLYFYSQFILNEVPGMGKRLEEGRQE